MKNPITKGCKNEEFGKFNAKKFHHGATSQIRRSGKESKLATDEH